MASIEIVLKRFDDAMRDWTAACHQDPSVWHRADIATFRDLLPLLLRHAEAGNADCQYAVATIYWLGACCDTEAEFLSGYENSILQATQWWLRAARQGDTRAIDNLITCGVGPTADEVRLVSCDVERERADLIGRSGGMPVYADRFMGEVLRRMYWAPKAS